MKTILVLTTTYPRWRGDTEPAFVHNLSVELVRDFAVHVLAPHVAGAARRETMDGVEVHRFAYLPQHWQRLAYDSGIVPKLKARPALLLQVPFLCLMMLWQALRLVRTQEIDLVHAHWIIPQGFIALLVKALSSRRVQVLTTSHGADLYGLRGGLWRSLKRWALRNADGVTVVSAAMQRVCVEQLGVDRPIVVAAMGIDCQKTFVPKVAHAARSGVVYVGRLVAKKGVADLITAFAQVAPCQPDENLSVVGDGPERAALEALASELGIAHRIQFVGAVEAIQVARYMNQAKVCVMPSVVAEDGDQEGLGLVAGEALASGCITIVSNLDAIQDVHNEPLLQYPAGDAERLADRLRYVYEQPSAAMILTESLRAAVIEKFDWPRVGVRYRELIVALLAE